MKDIISTQLGDLRFVATGKTLHYGKKWQVFPDFLAAYLAGLLNPKWGVPQLKLPLEQQHPINQWYTLLARSDQLKKRNEDGLFICNTGATMAWFRLAYDLYLIEHNAELQRRLIRKLRNPSHFQGARFEAATAAIMLSVDYRLEFSKEKGPGKHPEFLAKNQSSGVQIAVEAKSKHRSGVLGFSGGKDSRFDGNFKIYNLLKQAVLKDTDEPLVVFIEINAPIKLTHESRSDIYNQINKAWGDVQSLDWPNGFPCVAAFFYNDVSPWFLNQPLESTEIPIWAMALWPKTSRHGFKSKEFVLELMNGFKHRCDIPQSRRAGRSSDLRISTTPITR